MFGQSFNFFSYDGVASGVHHSLKNLTMFLGMAALAYPNDYSDSCKCWGGDYYCHCQVQWTCHAEELCREMTYVERNMLSSADTNFQQALSFNGTSAQKAAHFSSLMLASLQEIQDYTSVTPNQCGSQSSGASAMLSFFDEDREIDIQATPESATIRSPR